MRPDTHRQPRQRCLGCHRPQAACICRMFRDDPPIDNRTRIVVLQHPRETFHPFGTARIARLGVKNIDHHVARGPGWRGLSGTPELPPNCGLLYPHATAQPLAAVTPANAPNALLLLDGTWANVTKLYRENPWLAQLPHYSLNPAVRSRYRIRGQPSQDSLSTVEAIVEALTILEPETDTTSLLRVFCAMIDAQLNVLHSLRNASPRRRLRARPSRTLPPALLGDPKQILLVYGESAPDGSGRRRLVHWAAWRPATGEHFDQLICWPNAQPDPHHLAYMQLSPDDIADGVDERQLNRLWRDFSDNRAVCVAWNAGTLDLLCSHLGDLGAHVLLKASYCNLAHTPCGSLAQVVERERLTPIPTGVRARAGMRLGQAAAVLARVLTQA